MKTVVLKTNLGVFILSFLVLVLIQCYQVNVHEETSTYVLPLHFSYGLVKGAKIEIEFTCDEAISLYAVLLNSQQLQDLLKAELSYPKKSYVHPCKIQTQNRFEFKNYIKKVINISKTDQYTIGILNCKQELITIDGKVHYQNTFRPEFPEGKQYSPEIYGCASIINILFFIIWTRLLVKNWKIRKSFQICIWLIFLAKNAQLILNMINSVQLLTKKQSFQTISVISNILHALVRDSTLILVLLIALGFTTVRSTLTINEKITISIYSILYTFFDIFNLNCEETFGKQSNKCTTFYLISNGLHFFITFAIIAGFNGILEQLRPQIERNGIPNKTEAQHQFYIGYQKIRCYFFYYLVIPLIILIVQSTVLHWSREWLIVLFTELFELFFLLLPSYYFRPLITNPFLYFEVYQEKYQMDKGFDFESDYEPDYVHTEDNDIQIDGDDGEDCDDGDDAEPENENKDVKQEFNIDIGGLESSDFI
ncbi:lung seven transmembrane receptor [Anaeramoeba flamelloides]|uniref:Lung seven transmembrane receptor n=1 Tax=Anaeramoeba flamelloides TaxID=1746091 RepID=A0AAV7YML4_9EUKA|nr:lung seven transmembrane receptor [Anaeramoeba flamelloides]